MTRYQAMMRWISSPKRNVLPDYVIKQKGRENRESDFVLVVTNCAWLLTMQECRELLSPGSVVIITGNIHTARVIMPTQITRLLVSRFSPEYRSEAVRLLTRHTLFRVPYLIVDEEAPTIDHLKQLLTMPRKNRPDPKRIDSIQ